MTLLQFDTYHSDRSDHVGRGVGPVVISVEEDPRSSNRRPVAAWGIVISGHKVQGRKAPPGPLTGSDTGVLAQADRGHIFALELGGPNVAENIVPQWAFFQEHGTWRQMEATVAAAARSSTVFYRVELVYTGGGRRARFPARFKVLAHTMNADQVAVFVAAPTTYCPRVVSHLEFNGKVLDGTDGAAFSGNPNSWHTDTPEMFSAHMGKKKIVTPWR
jgi:hypothetical protein